MKKLYAERDPIALDKAGNYYCRHVHAMTAEGLHDKAAIAEELAHRDMEIDRLRKDAERYRWLRIQRSIAVTSFDQSVEYQGSDLDEAVDAAMQGANV